jgi:Na+/serine symporter
MKGLGSIYYQAAISKGAAIEAVPRKLHVLVLELLAVVLHGNPIWMPSAFLVSVLAILTWERQ